MIKLGDVLGEVGLKNVDAGLSREDAEWLARQLGGLMISSRWGIGDLVNLIEELFGEESAQLLNAFGLAEKTLSNIAAICRKVPPKARRADLSWSHHEAIAVLDDSDAMIEWLGKAAENHWTRDELRMAMIHAGVIKASGRVERAPVPAPDPYGWDLELQADVRSAILGQLTQWSTVSEGIIVPGGDERETRAILHRELEELASKIATAIEQIVCPAPAIAP